MVDLVGSLDRIRQQCDYTVRNLHLFDFAVLLLVGDCHVRVALADTYVDDDRGLDLESDLR